MPCCHQPGLACVTWETSTNDIFTFSSSTGTSVVTLAKCFNDGNIFRGLFHRELSLCHRLSRVVPATIRPVFAPAGFQREHLMNLHVLCSVLPLACSSTVLAPAARLHIARQGSRSDHTRNKVFGSCLPPNSCGHCSENMLQLAAGLFSDVFVLLHMRSYFPRRDN